MENRSNPCFLVADVGGTNTRVALFNGMEVMTASVRRYRNADFPSLEAVLHQYMSDEGGAAPRAVCIDIAGPVQGDTGQLTNRNWHISEAGVAEATGAPKVALLNDLQAQGYALPHVASENLLMVRQGVDASENAPSLVVNLGTGFNATPVLSAPSGPVVAISESGHATMPVRTQQDMRLIAFVEAFHGFAAIDDILSGRGLEHVYAFLAGEAGAPGTKTSSEIIEGCAGGTDALCVETVRYFTELTALVVGNLALIHLPFGGIYMVGGLSSALAPYLADFGFNAAFKDKGRFASFMDAFSIYILQDDYAALKGNAAYLNKILD
ncbi:MAG: glucokinase [Pseudomonadota bacterium]